MCTFIWGVFSSIVTVIIIRTVRKFKIWIRLKDLNGDYDGFNLDGTKHEESKKYKVIYTKKNIISLNNILNIVMTSTDKGNWKSTIIINDYNPLLAVGTFEYDTKGRNKEDCGTHKIQINKRAKEIYIHATTVSRKTGSSEVEYKIKKIKKSFQ